MAFRYDPNAPVYDIIPAGSYMATILSVEERTSSKGNPMLEFRFDLYLPGGGQRTMKDWIVETMAWKLGKIADAIGKSDVYASGEFNPQDYIGCNLEVVVEHKPDKRDGGMRAQIVGFNPLPVSKAATTAGGKGGKDATVKDDDIPF